MSKKPTDLEKMLEEHTAAAYSRGHDEGVRDALDAMTRVLGDTWIDRIGSERGTLVVGVSAPGGRLRYVPLEGLGGGHLRPDANPLARERIVGPAHEVIPQAVRVALGR